MEKKTIGKFIAALRKANGMTQRELGEKLFVSDKTVSRWECDECTPELNLIPSIAEIFGVTTDELLRGERTNFNRDDESAETVNKRKVKSEKQFKLILNNQKKKFANLSLISIMLVIIGFIVAVIFNNGFHKGLIGFLVACIFFLAASVCQICFTVNLRFLIDEDNNGCVQDLKKANTDMVLTSVKILFTTILVCVFCFPIAVLSYGSVVPVFSTWLIFGTMFAAVAFIVLYCVYTLFVKKILVKKEWIFVEQEEMDNLVKRVAVMKKCCVYFAIVFSMLFIALIIVSVIDENNGFTEVKKFNNPDEFIEYVQKQYDEWHENYRDDFYRETDNEINIDIDDNIGNSDKSDKDDVYADYSKTWAEIDEKKYYYNKNLYYIIDIDYNDGQYDITVITDEAHYNGIETVDLINGTIAMLHVANLAVCVVWYCASVRNKVKRCNHEKSL